jgi:MFS family permease
MHNAKPDERTFAVNSLKAGRNSAAALALLGLLGAAEPHAFVAGGILAAIAAWRGRLGLMLVGAAAFLAASALAVFTPGARTLIGSRVAQGLAAATLAPLALSRLRNFFPDPSDRSRAISIWTYSFLAGAAIGPLLGDALFGKSWWAVALIINLLAGIGLLVLTVALPGRTAPETERAHTLGALTSFAAGLSASGIGSLAEAIDAFLPAGAVPMSLVARRETGGLFRLADEHECEVLRPHIGGRNTLHVLHRHRIDDVVALGDVIDAEIVLPE